MCTFPRNTHIEQVAYIDKHACTDNRASGVQPILTGDLILAEVLQGFRSAAHLRSAQATMDTLFYEPMVGRHIAMASALNYRKLRAKGITPRKTIDMLIATFCMENGHQLLHADRDFEPMSVHLGLTVLSRSVTATT
ncbi:hypothetical protein [Candidatus Poriferisodalis sp.]|uniref:type II toxin-antitoxin system VapC family toxin n=1 Tax=Candidatus Poriferisodalis sp. TaxID=3101277 RepID=UPI003B0235E0